MFCVVTAGPTFEPLDAVRRLTNFSTGRLGTGLAAGLAAAGHRVLLLRGEMATAAPCADPRVEVRGFGTTAELQRHLAGLAGREVGAVFHAAAVSDFAVGRVFTREAGGDLVPIRAGKLPTRAGGLLAELVPTPKVIAGLRGWFPAARLVGWKYVVDGNRAGALVQAAEQIAACHTDACVANGPAYGAGFGWVRAGRDPEHCDGPESLWGVLSDWLATSPPSGVNRTTR